METEPTDFPERRIFVIGPLKLQNALICDYLSQTTEVECLPVACFEDIAAAVNGNNHQQNLLLWDCFGKDVQSCLLELESNPACISHPNLLGLFNVSPDSGIEEATLTSGVRGFFYQEDSVEQLCKGVLTIFNGELWISRKIMTNCILNGKSHDSHTRQKNSLLTSREIEILSIIAAGQTNETIADKLCISPHTVKTHVYNIFKKIDVPNRLQAALWAAKNL